MFATNTRLAQLFDTMVSHGQLIGESEKEKNGSGSKTRSAVRRSLTLQNLPRPPDNLNPSAFSPSSTESGPLTVPVNTTVVNPS